MKSVNKIMENTRVASGSSTKKTSAGAITDITGRTTQLDTLDTGDTNSIVTAFNQKQMLYFSSRGTTEVASNIQANHGYILVGYNSTTQKFKFFNPTGASGILDPRDNKFKDGFLELSFGDLVKNFDQWDRTV